MTNIIQKIHPIREAMTESHDNQLQDLAAELTDAQLERLAVLLKMEWQGLIKIR